MINRLKQFFETFENEDALSSFKDPSKYVKIIAVSGPSYWYRDYVGKIFRVFPVCAEDNRPGDFSVWKKDESRFGLCIDMDDVIEVQNPQSYLTVEDVRENTDDAKLRAYLTENIDNDDEDLSSFKDPTIYVKIVSSFLDQLWYRNHIGDIFKVYPETSYLKKDPAWFDHYIVFPTIEITDTQRGCQYLLRKTDVILVPLTKENQKVAKTALDINQQDISL